MKVLYRGMTLLGIFFSFTFAQSLESKLDALSKFQQKTQVVSLDYNPFATEAMIEKLQNNIHSRAEDKKSLRLVSVLNDKAFISGHWYGVGDAIDGGKIIAISPTSVRIKRRSHLETLVFEKSKKLLHVKDTQK